MKKTLLLALAVLSVAVAGSVSAKTVTMAITKNGYVPKTLSIATGDAVTFVNQDTAAHQVVLKPSTGFTCTGGLVLQPSQSTTCTFNVHGKYAVSDPNVKTAAFKGTITVTGANISPSVTLHASPLIVVYGGSSTLSGAISTGQTNQKVDVLAQECGASAMKPLATLTTTTGGAFTTTAQPHLNTAYQARFKSSTSAAVTVKVRPRLALRKLARRNFNVKVLAAQSFAGHAILFQRYVRSTSRWITVKTVLLKAGPTVTLPINPTITSTVTFRVRIKSRLKVRALLTQAQAGGCYLGARSAVIRS
jgi:plastocyanin